MALRDLRAYLELLESKGMLRRVRAPLDSRSSPRAC